MRIVWDEAKREANLRPPPDGHGLDFADARDRFDLADALVAPTYVGKDGRSRFLALGFFEGRLHALVFAPLGHEAIAFISFRPASTKERRVYDEAKGRLASAQRR